MPVSAAQSRAHAEGQHGEGHDPHVAGEDRELPRTPRLPADAVVVRHEERRGRAQGGGEDRRPLPAIHEHEALPHVLHERHELDGGEGETESDRGRIASEESAPPARPRRAYQGPPRGYHESLSCCLRIASEHVERDGDCHEDDRASVPALAQSLHRAEEEGQAHQGRGEGPL